uniref:Uncharacterized protein n=1 Tax=Arcella intermedia TaxID=1963864 RepID=A0A6B2LQQ0_9EUKA
MKAEGKSPISYDQGLPLASEISAAKYLECSGLSRTGLNSIFEEAVWVAISSKEPAMKEKPKAAKEALQKPSKPTPEGPLSEKERTFKARKSILDDLLKDGVISHDVHNHYILKLKATFDIN